MNTLDDSSPSEAVCKRNEQRIATLHILVAIDVHT
jgi:hypothetical protein